MQRYKQLLLDNKLWAKERLEQDAEFFTRSANAQKPHFMWIGCSDSRVPPNEITQMGPGELFVHRNVANLVNPADFCLLSSLQYAVEVLEVKHVVVCGQYGCSGVNAALSGKSFGYLDHWLTGIKDVYRLHREELDALSGQEKADRLCELNVQEQLRNLAKIALIQRSWKKHKRPFLHGWIYGLKDGHIKPLLEMPPESELDCDIYCFDNVDES